MCGVHAITDRFSAYIDVYLQTRITCSHVTLPGKHVQKPQLARLLSTLAGVIPMCDGRLYIMATYIEAIPGASG